MVRGFVILGTWVTFTALRMKVTDFFTQSKGKTLMSFEILPPLKGGSMSDIFRLLDALMEFKPPFIDVTYHREEYVYTKHESGYYEKTAIRKRPGTVGICAAIMHKYGEMCIRDRSKSYPQGIWSGIQQSEQTSGTL